MNKNDKIYIAGHTGLLGSAILRALTNAGYFNLCYRRHAEFDLTQQKLVEEFFTREKPDYVFLAAAKVGGIHANNHYRGEFIYQNLAIQTNIIEAARKHMVKRLIFFGSACSYPRDCPQPMKESYLLTGAPEPTNEAYAIAKIAGMKLCESYNTQYGTNFIVVMPTNLYGPNDSFDLEKSHVLPALMKKVHQAHITQQKEITIWGTGSPKREFLYVDDMAAACLFIMHRQALTPLINIGSGQEISIREVTELMCKVIGYQGSIIYDTSKPDGAPRKLLDSSQMHALGWRAQTHLQEGLQRMYQWYLTTLQQTAVA